MVAARRPSRPTTAGSSDVGAGVARAAAEPRLPHGGYTPPLPRPCLNPEGVAPALVLGRRAEQEGPPARRGAVGGGGGGQGLGIASRKWCFLPSFPF